LFNPAISFLGIFGRNQLWRFPDPGGTPGQFVELTLLLGALKTQIGYFRIGACALLQAQK